MSGTTDRTVGRTFNSGAYLSALFADMDAAQISLRIRQARKDAGYRSREQLADVLQVHHRTIENWEDPKNSNVPYDRMNEIADVLNVDKRWLLHGDAEPARGSIEERLDLILHRLEALEEQVERSTKATVEAIVLLGARQPQTRARKPPPRATGTDSG